MTRTSTTRTSTLHTLPAASSHIVCYSGGHSSALVAIEVVREFGPENVTLLNHDIIERSEVADIKRFKHEVAEYLELSITYANMYGWDVKDQFDVVVESSAFKVGTGTALCSNRMKTMPFEKWLGENADSSSIIYYGFDKNETARIQRRSSHLALLGYRSDYPLALWSSRTIYDIEEIGIKRPNTYSQFKHANCVGCLKAGKQHWYVVYCTRPDVWAKAKLVEESIGYTIIKDQSLSDLEPLFERMKQVGIIASEHIPQQLFWARVKDVLDNSLWVDDDVLPCECIV